MDSLLATVEKQSLKKAPPVLRVGNTVRVHQSIKEGSKQRVQMFEGLVIATNGGNGMAGTFTVRRVSGGYGVEKVFPIHSSTIVKVEVTREAKVRRAKLYYLRGLKGKAARLKETIIHGRVFDEKAAEDALKKEEEAAKEKEESA